MSNIVCAYCHIKGHHIKFCEELAEKNRRKNSRFAISSHNTDAQVLSTHKNLPVVAAKKTQSRSNVFADLYSSEEEEGEIVEDRLSAHVEEEEGNRFAFHTITPESSDSEQTNSWCRSGIKGVVIPVKYTIRNIVSDDDDSDSNISYEMSPVFQEAIKQMRMYNSQYDGMSWADIECE